MDSSTYSSTPAIRSRTAAAVSFLSVVLLVVTSGAQALIYVGEPTNGCPGADYYCQGPSKLKYKPRSLRLVAPGDGYFIVDVKHLHWSHWGQKRAIGRGKTRTGDPDNGYQSGRAKVVLSHKQRTGCGDESSKFTAYGRAVLRAPAAGVKRYSFYTLGC